MSRQEARELRNFRNIVLAAITIGAIAIALNATSAWGLLITAQSMYLVIGCLYAFRLPRILDRRMAWERSVNPERAKQSRRQWMWATIGRAVGAAIGGAVIMAILISGTLN
jgi:hypothetical protein